MCNQISFDERVKFFASIAMVTVVISDLQMQRLITGEI